MSLSSRRPSVVVFPPIILNLPVASRENESLVEEHDHPTKPPDPNVHTTNGPGLMLCFESEKINRADVCLLLRLTVRFSIPGKSVRMKSVPIYTEKIFRSIDFLRHKT
jgi:hypothetical protein